MSDENTLPLSDVTLERARMENDTIDEQFSDLESKVATLQSEVDDKQQALEDERSAREDLQTVVGQYREKRADELLDDIRTTIAGAAVSEDDFEYDFDALEDADIDTLETVKSAVSATVSAAGLDQTDRVGNTGSKPDLASVEDETGPDASEEAARVAEELGMSEEWQKVQAGEQLAEPKHIDLGSSGKSEAADELASLLREVSE